MAVPFASRSAALRFFGGPSLTATAWVEGLEKRAGGLWPRFDLSVVERMLRMAADRSYWDDWARIRCRTLVVRAGNGTLSRAEAEAMVTWLPQASLVELPGAEHDLHLDRPCEWRAALTEFLKSLP